MVKASDRISKLPAGFFALDPELTKQLKTAKKSVKHKETAWIVNALKRAAETGYDQTRMQKVILKTADIIASDKRGKELVSIWNQKC